MVWRLSVNLEFAGTIENEYPQFVSRWLHINDKITSALQWINGRTYFFSQKSYYRYDHINQQVSTTSFNEARRALFVRAGGRRVSDLSSADLGMVAAMLPTNDLRSSLFSSLEANVADTDVELHRTACQRGHWRQASASAPDPTAPTDHHT